MLFWKVARTVAWLALAPPEGILRQQSSNAQQKQKACLTRLHEAPSSDEIDSSGEADDPNRNLVNEKYDRMLAWLKNYDADVSDKILLRDSDVGAGYGTFSSDDVSEGELLFTIPRKACVTMDDVLGDPDCGEAFSEFLENDKGPGGDTVCLAGFLAKEYLIWNQTRLGDGLENPNTGKSFAPYLATLPWERWVNQQDHLLFWKDADVESLLKGSRSFHEAVELRAEVRRAAESMKSIVGRSIAAARVADKPAVESKTGGFVWPWDRKPAPKKEMSTSDVTSAKQGESFPDMVVGLPDAVKGAFVCLLTRSFPDGEAHPKLVPLLDMLQHSDESNVVYTIRESDGAVEVRAKVGIASGDELVTSYQPTEDPLSPKLFFLRFGFVHGIEESIPSLASSESAFNDDVESVVTLNDAPVFDLSADPVGTTTDDKSPSVLSSGEESESSSSQDVDAPIVVRASSKIPGERLLNGSDQSRMETGRTSSGTLVQNGAPRVNGFQMFLNTLDPEVRESLSFRDIGNGKVCTFPPGVYLNSRSTSLKLAELNPASKPDLRESFFSTLDPVMKEKIVVRESPRGVGTLVGLPPGVYSKYRTTSSQQVLQPNPPSKPDHRKSFLDTLNNVAKDKVAVRESPRGAGKLFGLQPGVYSQTRSTRPNEAVTTTAARKKIDHFKSFLDTVDPSLKDQVVIRESNRGNGKLCGLPPGVYLHHPRSPSRKAAESPAPANRNRFVRSQVMLKTLQPNERNERSARMSPQGGRTLNGIQRDKVSTAGRSVVKDVSKSDAKPTRKVAKEFVKPDSTPIKNTVSKKPANISTKPYSILSTEGTAIRDAKAVADNTTAASLSEESLSEEPVKKTSGAPTKSIAEPVSEMGRKDEETDKTTDEDAKPEIGTNNTLKDEETVEKASTFSAKDIMAPVSASDDMDEQTDETLAQESMEPESPSTTTTETVKDNNSTSVTPPTSSSGASTAEKAIETDESIASDDVEIENASAEDKEEDESTAKDIMEPVTSSTDQGKKETNSSPKRAVLSPNDDDAKLNRVRSFFDTLDSASKNQVVIRKPSGGGNLVGLPPGVYLHARRPKREEAKPASDSGEFRLDRVDTFLDSIDPLTKGRKITARESPRGGGKVFNLPPGVYL